MFRSYHFRYVMMHDDFKINNMEKNKRYSTLSKWWWCNICHDHLKLRCDRIQYHAKTVIWYRSNIWTKSLFQKTNIIQLSVQFSMQSSFVENDKLTHLKNNEHTQWIWGVTITRITSQRKAKMKDTQIMDRRQCYRRNLRQLFRSLE